jgi:gliding motility associated protien GldN
MKKYSLTLLGIFIFSLSFSQSVLEKDSYKMNNKYEKSQHMERDVVKLAPLREADVMWSRKIWREIDLRQKMNHPFYYPQEGEAETVDRDNLFTVLYNAATHKGEFQIRAFNANNDDEFQEEISATDLMTLIEGTEEEYFFKDEFGEDSTDVNGKLVVAGIKKTNNLNQRDIKKWRIKEQWFFDKQRSVMDVRIIGLCPIADDRDEDGFLTGSPRPICWFYFPEVRHVLKNALAFNLVKNEAENKTFEDIFMKRMFASTIVKEGNVYDRDINQYKIGLDALLEAQRIKEEIFNIEHDLWEY